MVSNQAALDRAFTALGDATRRSILARLAKGEATVGEVAQPYRLTRPAISKHLRALERAGLVRLHRSGRITICRLNAAPLREASAWIDQYRLFWEGMLEPLARFLEADEQANGEKKR
jgi:DNA-binding transcriptional ArsR family regulator